MTILGVPDGSGFTIGTSSGIAAPSGGGSSMDVSLDDMIRNRRNKPTRPTRASTVDRSVAKGRAKRDAAANARRGLSDNKRPSEMHVENEVNREARRSARTRKPVLPAGRKPKPEGIVKAKARQETKRRQETRSRPREDNVIPPAWIGGTRRPPSKKAVTAAVEAMTDAGFKVPRGMQMVISFAPAPDRDPTMEDDRGKSSFRSSSRSSSSRGGRGRGRGRSNDRGSDRDRDRDRGGDRGRGRGGGRGGGRSSGRGGGRGGGGRNGRR